MPYLKLESYGLRLFLINGMPPQKKGGGKYETFCMYKLGFPPIKWLYK